MTQSSTQPNTAAPITEPNKVPPAGMGPQKTDADKNAAAEKAKTETNGNVKAA